MTATMETLSSTIRIPEIPLKALWPEAQEGYKRKVHAIETPIPCLCQSGIFLILSKISMADVR